MKRFLLSFLVLTALLGCRATNHPKKITPDNLHEIVSYLASDSLKGRQSGSKGAELSATYIENYFKTIGIKPYYKSYRDNFKIKDSLDAFNVIGVLEGTDPILKNEIVMLSAHYDHIGEGKSITKFGGRLTDIDSIANGANDNASGTATVLALAKYFANAKNNKRTLMFVLFSGEEFGLLGSKHLAERLKYEHFNLYTMVNFEMMGIPFTDNRGYDVFLTGYDLSNMGEKMNAYKGSNFVGFSEASKRYHLFRGSDNYSFYEVFKVPCHTIASCDLTNYDYYHHVDDEANKQDYKYMANVANKLVPAIEAMANSKTHEIKMNDE